MSTKPEPDRFSEDRPVEAMPMTVLESITKAEVDVAIATAHRFPRSIERFRKLALSLATIDEDIALSCFFKLPKGKDDEGKQKFIEGPSVRLAEIVASTYGNIRVAARVVEVGLKEVVAQGVAIDLESNYSTSVEVRMSIVGKYGRYKEDLINTTANACCAKARRNAMFATIPFAVVKPIYEAAKKVAIGTAKTLTERRAKSLEAIDKAGISNARVFSVLGVKGIDDIGLEQLETLRGLWSAVKEGEQSADTVFPDPAKAGPAEGARFSDDKKPETKTEVKS